MSARYLPRHQAHADIFGNFQPINVPPPDLAPKAAAKALETYRALATEHRSVARQLSDIRDNPPPGGTPKVDADTRRVTLEDAQAELEPRLDDALGELIAAVNASGWADQLTDAQTAARQAIADATDTIETAVTQLAELGRIDTWLAGFPSHKGWPDDQFLNHPRYGQPRLAGQPVDVVVAPLRALATIGNGDDAA